MKTYEQLDISDLLNKTKEYESEIKGIELINEGDDLDEIEKPYDASTIRIENKVFSVFQVNTWIQNGSIILMPDFQRNNIWSRKQKSLLIESLMLRITLPAFYLSEDENGVKSVIDGLQRLSAISEYMNDEYPLENLQYLTVEAEGKCFSELHSKYKRRIEDGQLFMNILDERCPEQVKYDVFRRVNTGGIPLNDQEIRNVLLNNNVRALLKNMANAEEFKTATRHLINDARMDAQELCLRYIAFLNIYDSNRQMIVGNHTIHTANLLDECGLKLNEYDENQLDDILIKFKESMLKCNALLGNHAFSKKPGKIINKVLFTSWSVTMTFCEISLDDLLNHQNIAKELLDEKLADNKFNASITSSTGSRQNIQRQYQMINDILRRLFYDK